MKFILTFKTEDTMVHIHRKAVLETQQLINSGMLDPKLYHEVRLKKEQEMYKASKAFCIDDDHVLIEFDTETGFAVVLPNKE